MPQKNAQDRLWKILTPVLLVLAVLAMAKTLFVGLEIDEEYAFSLGFRLVKGDRLFYTMWEPHQLSNRRPKSVPIWKCWPCIPPLQAQPPGRCCLCALWCWSAKRP